MGRKPSGLIKERKHIHLTEGNWDRLVELYRSQGITPSHVIDRLVAFHLKRIDEKINLKKGNMHKVLEEEAEIDVDISQVTT